ncbi:MAG: hypothetical protein AAF617_15000 [Bacteroidota bacterium]
MKKIYIIASLVLLAIGCSPWNSMNKAELEEYKNLKKFDANDFRIYVFNLCEKYAKEVENIERFCKCPDDFYNVALKDSVKKIEELYLLLHRKTDLALYFTTESHKYIREDLTGFLNSPALHENKIALEKVESIYIGRHDDSNDLIHFPSYQDEKDIILHYTKDQSTGEIFFYQGNIATAENDYDIAEPILLDSVFNEKLIYKLAPEYRIAYHNAEMTANADWIFIFSDRGKVGITFGFSNLDDFYKVESDRIRYHPNYSLIQTH